MILSPPIAQPKGKTRKQIKSARDRREALIIKTVRAACVARDGYCRVTRDMLTCEALGACAGASALCHLPPRTRGQTRKMDPEYRHGTPWCVMCCTRHHDMINRRRKPWLIVRCLSDRGLDGPVSFDVERG